MTQASTAATTLTVFDTPTDRDHATVINVEQLQKGLMAQRGATIITFVAHTEPKMLKKHRDTKEPNPYLGRNIVKVARVNGMVNFHYNEGVLRRLAKEGKSPDEFKQGTSWHTAILTEDGKLTPLCRHKDIPTKVYVRFMLQGSLDSEYRDLDTGECFSKEQLAPYLPKPSEYENQGLDNPLIFLTYGLDSIREISIGGQKYVIA